MNKDILTYLRMFQQTKAMTNSSQIHRNDIGLFNTER